MRRFFIKQALLLGFTIALVLSLPSCSERIKPGDKRGVNVRLNGAGSTFVYPLFSKLFDEYTKVEPSVTVNYQSIGSGAGIKQIVAKTVDFGATDAPVTDEQLKEAPGILHIPVTIGGVAIIYNLPGIKSGLKLSPDVLAAVYLGKIKKWNDPAITKLNPGLKLPDDDILVVRRSDGSGTTFIFTDYLSQVSPEWSSKVGKSTSVNWPVGLGAKGNEGVAGQVSQTTGAVGYVELAYAIQNDLKYAALGNRSGRFVKPSIASVIASAEGIALPADLRLSSVNSPNKDAYPITGFTWVLVYQNQRDKTKGKALAKLLWWMVHEGKKFSKALDYSPLPDDVVKADEEKIGSIAANGRPLLKVR